MTEFSTILFAQNNVDAGFLAQTQAFFAFITQHWRFCLLHFLEFAIWGAWFVVLGNFLNARGFSRKHIGRIYSTIPIGAIISPLFIGAVADKYLNTEMLIGVSHLIGAVLLLAMARTSQPRLFYWITFAYALVFAPTLSLVNSIVFAHDQDIFGGAAGEGFPWIRVFGTLGWIAAGMSHALFLKKGEPVNERPLLLACVLSVMLGLFAFTLPETKPAAQVDQQDVAVSEESVDQGNAASVGVIAGAARMLADHPIFFGVSLVTAMAMGLYFAFTALFLEQSGVPPNVVGPVMTIGQWIEIFFMLTLPWFLGPDNIHMNWVLLVGICAWSLRFGLFTIGRPFPVLLVGVAVHGICFDFFFAAGMINTAAIAPAELTATAQALYGFLVYGLGMYLGSEGSGWLNQYFTKTVSKAGEEAKTVTNWRGFWLIPCIIITLSAIAFGLSQMGETSTPPPVNDAAAEDQAAVIRPLDEPGPGWLAMADMPSEKRKRALIPSVLQYRSARCFFEPRETRPSRSGYPSV